MRPRLHLTPDRGWLNDPHGITARDGGYHLFHQAVPDSLTHQTTCSWGHATSPDLVHWEHRPTALAPDADEDGVWTGSLVTQGDDATIFYTAVDLVDTGVGRVRVARPVDPAWDTWEKGEVVVHAPEQLDLVEFRDPFVIREGSGWRMFVAGAERGGRAVVPTWVSDDLRSWGVRRGGPRAVGHRAGPVDGRDVGVPAVLPGRRRVGDGRLGLVPSGRTSTTRRTRSGRWSRGASRSSAGGGSARGPTTRRRTSPTSPVGRA